jgi:hypothetical protein
VPAAIAAPQCAGLAAARHGYRHAKHIGDDLRPDAAARTAARQHNMVEIGARFVQRFDMAVLEGDTLEQRRWSPILRAAATPAPLPPFSAVTSTATCSR